MGQSGDNCKLHRDVEFLNASISHLNSSDNNYEDNHSKKIT